jgi:hypothetical protein
MTGESMRMDIPTTITTSQLSTMAAAAGALGTACFGMVEALKWTPLGDAGFRQIGRFLGPDLMKALFGAYGKGCEQLLKAQYREDSSHQSGIAKTLRQGVRLGLTAHNATAIAEYLGSVDGASLKSAADAVAHGATLTSEQRGAIGRFEMAVDARIESALARAQDLYLGAVRCTASVLAIAIAELVVAIQHVDGVGWLHGLLVGLVAVPLAPIANDLVGALQAAAKAMAAR